MNALDAVPGMVLFTVGRSPVTIGALTAAVAVAFAAFAVAGGLGAALQRLRGRVGAGAASLYVVEKVVTYGLVIAGLVAAVSMLGINLTSLAVFAGALGVGAGLGLQGVVKEFVSGLVLIFEGVIRVGDYIELDGGSRGEVQEIGPRAMRIRSNDSVDILLPNSRLIEQRVTNWTHKGGTRRIHIPFTVAYGSDRNLVRQAGLEAAAAVPFTLPDQGARRSQVWLVGFGESGLRFELLVWPELSAVKRPNAAQAAYTWAIADALDAHGIEVPFPQMDVRLRGLFGREGDEALAALRLGAAPAPPVAAAAPGANDAVEDLAAGQEEDQSAAQAASASPPEGDKGQPRP